MTLNFIGPFPCSRLVITVWFNSNIFSHYVKCLIKSDSVYSLLSILAERWHSQFKSLTAWSTQSTASWSSSPVTWYWPITDKTWRLLETVIVRRVRKDNSLIVRQTKDRLSHTVKAPIFALKINHMRFPVAWHAVQQNLKTTFKGDVQGKFLRATCLLFSELKLKNYSLIDF